MLELTINNQFYTVKNAAEFISIYNNQKDNEFMEIDFKFIDEKSMFVLLNKKYALVVYFRYFGDSGYSSINKDINDRNKNEKFRLSNGQVDEYPIEKLVERGLAINVICEFINTGNMSDKIGWHED